MCSGQEIGTRAVCGSIPVVLIREIAPESYQTLADYVRANMTAEGLDWNLNERAVLYETENLTELTEETVADAFGRILGDKKHLSQFAQNNRGVMEKVMDALRDIVAAVKRILSGQNVSLTREQKKAFRDLLGKSEEMMRVLQDAVREAGTKNAAREGGEGTGNVKHSYAGEKAKTANAEKLRAARELDRQGADAETIRQETGWFKGMDGKWRFEIDDSGMEYRRDGDAQLLREPEYRRLQELTQKWADSFEKDGPALTEREEAEMERLQEEYKDRVWNEKYLLRDFLKHDALFEAYPYLNRVSLAFDETESGTNGYFDRGSNTIVLSDSLIGATENTLIHEIQHVIQKVEGFASGSSPAYWARRDYETGDMVETRLQNKKDRILRGLSREERNDYTRYSELERELGRLFLSEENSEEGARYVKLEAEQDAIYEKLYPNQWFRDLLDIERRKSEPGEVYNELYRNTAGEIEARDVSARRGLTAEQRRATPPALGDENTVFAEDGGYFAMSVDEQAGVRGQLRDHQDELNRMEPVGEVNTQDYAGLDTRTAREKLVRELKKTGYQVDRPGFGVIQFGENEINNSLSYREKDAASEDARRTGFLLLKNVLKRGIEISGHDNHKGRGYDTLTIAAPVEINGQRGNMAVIVKQTKGNRYKVHRILTPTGDAFALPKMANAEMNTVGAVTNGSQSLGGSAPAINSASNQIIRPNGQDVNGKFSKSDRDLLKKYVKEYGAIPRGETPSREIVLPKRTGDGRKLSQTVRTVLEASATPDEMVPTIEKMAAAGEFSYDAYTDKQAIEDAAGTIKQVGWAQALTDWTDGMRRGEVSKANTAMGWALYNNAANSGDVKTAITVLEQMVAHQRSAAQALQATRILKKMSPDAQLYQAQRSVENLQEEINIPALPWRAVRRGSAPRCRSG